MKRNIIAVLTAIAATSSLNASAEGLLEIYHLSKQNDAGLKSAAATYKAAEEAVEISRANLFPSISLSGSLGYESKEVESDKTNTNSNSISLDLSYPIYSAALNDAVDVVKLDYKNAEVTYQTAEEDLSYKALEAYFNLLTQTSDLKIAQAQAKATASQLQSVKKQFEVGQVAITDVHSSQAEYDSNLADILSAESGVINAQETLRTLTGKLVSNIPDLAKDYPITMEDEQSTDYFLEMAEKQNKSLQALKISYESASTNISLQKANGRSPTVTLNGGLSTSNAKTDTTDQGTTTSSVSLNLSMPLYEGGSISASVRQAVNQAEAARETLNATRQDIDLSVRKLYRTLQTNVAQIKAQQQLIKSYSSVLKATQAGYNAGTRNIVELLDAQSDLFDAQGRYEQLRYTFVLNKLSLLKLAGELNEENVVKLDAWLKM